MPGRGQGQATQGLGHPTRSCRAVLQMWTGMPRGWTIATPMPCVRTHPPPTSAPAGLATRGRAGGVRVSDLGTSRGAPAAEASLALALAAHVGESAALPPPAHQPLPAAHFRSLRDREHRVFLRAGHTVLSASALSFCLASKSNNNNERHVRIFWSRVTQLRGQKVSSLVGRESHATRARLAWRLPEAAGTFTPELECQGLLSREAPAAVFP